MDPYRASDPYQQPAPPPPTDPYRDTEPFPATDPYRATEPFPPTDPYRATEPYQPAPAPPADPYRADPYPVSGTPATAPLPSPHAPPPAGHGGYGAAAYGYDPTTGQALSDKSKVVAGLLQIALGFIFTLGGVGRLYAGNTAIGMAQLAASVVAWASFWCGFAAGFPFAVWFGIWLWFVIDGIMMIAGRPVDGQGRLLRS